MASKRVSLVPGKTYHSYNHANGNDVLFKNDGNYRYFLKKYAEYLFPTFDTFAYCLLPNHFHFLIRVKAEKTIVEALGSDPKGFLKPLGSSLRGSLSHRLAHKVGSFQNAYAKAFNKQHSRMGSLFMQSFGRTLVKDDSYYLRLICYIHLNAVHHGFVRNVSEWPYSSYHTYLTTKVTRLDREEVVLWFGGEDNFIKFHQQGISIDKDLILEMEETP